MVPLTACRQLRRSVRYLSQYEFGQRRLLRDIGKHKMIPTCGCPRICVGSLAQVFRRLGCCVLFLFPNVAQCAYCGHNMNDNSLPLVFLSVTSLVANCPSMIPRKTWGKDSGEKAQYCFRASALNSYRFVVLWCSSRSSCTLVPRPGGLPSSFALTFRPSDCNTRVILSSGEIALEPADTQALYGILVYRLVLWPSNYPRLQPSTPPDYGNGQGMSKSSRLCPRTSQQVCNMTKDAGMPTNS